MKVVLTGATGFIGRHLVARLLERGDSVTVLTRNRPHALQMLSRGTAALEWLPPTLGGDWEEEVASADAVVNLAGEPVADKRWTETQKQRIARSRLDATNAIVTAFHKKENGAGLLINGSAIGYYGSRADEVLTEESTPGNDFLASVVTQWEEAARQAEALGARVALIRTGIVLGANGGALPRMSLPFKVFAGGVMGPPDQWVSWIHIEDEIELILWAIDNSSASGPINATAPNPVTMAVFSHSIGAALSRPVWAPGIPAVMKLILGERSEVVFASQRVQPNQALHLGFEFRHTEIDKAIESALVGREQSKKL